MTTLVFLLEEPSAKELLLGVLPRLLPASVSVHYMVFEGKSDLEKRMAGRIRGWRTPDTKFVILRDQDANPDCREIKRRLQAIADQSGRTDALVRIACRELEAWVLGDWLAIATAFGRPDLAAQGAKAMYKDPDGLSNPVEEIRKFIRDYQKVDGARQLGRLLDPATNASRSFRAFCRGVTQLVAFGR